MGQMKEYFLAGLAVEEAIERRDNAREALREAAAKACPEELKALNEASEHLANVEKHLNQVVHGLVTGQPTGDVPEEIRKHFAGKRGSN